MNVLHLIANPKPSETSVSKKLALEFFSTLMEKDPDVVVLTMPVWINSMPAILKAWLDQIVVPGKLYRMGPDGPVPTHPIRTLVLLVSSDSGYKEDDPADGVAASAMAELLLDRGEASRAGEVLRAADFPAALAHAEAVLETRALRMLGRRAEAESRWSRYLESRKGAERKWV